MEKSDVILSENRNYCIVDGNLDYHGNKIAEQRKTNETKTKAGTREVDINSRAVEIYKEACSLSPNSEFIFTTKNGTPLQPSAINTFLRNNKEEMNIPKNKRISTHIFRHTHISKLAELEVPLYVIQKRVGHSSSKVTEKIYLHVTEKMKEKTRNLLEFL
ncbi:Phage integrase [Lactococcus lactis subsp. lactis]|nr:Phage integrase [Lactococcus lactis subsp. lactis]